MHLTGRNAATPDTVAKEIPGSGGPRAHRVDATDEDAVENHSGTVTAQAGSLDISFNASAAAGRCLSSVPGRV